VAACGGSGSGSATTQPAASPTVTITAAGTSPSSISLNAGGQVTFVNKDAVPHTMFSSPHPEHTDCPTLNQVGFLQPGESRQSGNLNTAMTCGFHDETSPLNELFQGSIVVH
jgi:plastocyanin